MARIRTIKPAFFRDFDLFQLERESGLPVRVAFAGLWTVADKEGRFAWKPKELQPDVLPHDGVNFNDVLTALERGRFICRYEVGGRAYGLVRSWDKHQRPRKDEEDSKLPPPPVDSDDVVAEQSLGKERKGKEVEGKGTEEGAASLLDAPPPSADSPVVLVFPTQGHVREWRLRQVQVDEWLAAYPSLDIVAECRRAHAWVLANPNRAKTAKGMCAFLVNWFNRSVDRGGARGGPAPAPKPGLTGRIPEQKRTAYEDGVIRS